MALRSIGATLETGPGSAMVGGGTMMSWVGAASTGASGVAIAASGVALASKASALCLPLRAWLPHVRFRGLARQHRPPQAAKQEKAEK